MAGGRVGTACTHLGTQCPEGHLLLPRARHVQGNRALGTLQAAAGSKDSSSGGGGETQTEEAAPTVPHGTHDDASDGNMGKQAGGQAECNNAELAKTRDGVCPMRALPALQAHYHDIGSAGAGSAQVGRYLKNGGRQAGWAGLRGAIGHCRTMLGVHPEREKRGKRGGGCAKGCNQTCARAWAFVSVREQVRGKVVS